MPISRHTRAALPRTRLLLAGAAVAALVLTGGALAFWPQQTVTSPSATSATTPEPVEPTERVEPADEPADEPAAGAPERPGERPGRGVRPRAEAPQPSPARPSPPPPREPEPNRQETVPDGGDVVTTGTCQASFYWEPQPTASGEPFDPEAMTAAHKTWAFGTRVRVTNPANGRSVVVRINDRGPYIDGRCLDLARGAFREIAPLEQGVATVTYEVLSD